ncbi:MAG: response regulator [Bacteroidales bacterium]|nr:response regulator [Bacteroidales bacterium]
MSKVASALRNVSNFDGALENHLAALEVATELDDTLKVIKMMNQIATDHRRKGTLEEAIHYHYEALELCTQLSDTTTYDARKSIVNSLNGIGNVALPVGNDRTAEAMFRDALKGESFLESELGMAINCANLGSIMENRGELDSALVWYTRALDHNRAADSDLGVGLCHNYFGSIYYKQGYKTQALIEFMNSYEILKGVGDDWHTIEPCFSLATMYLSEKKYPEAYQYIQQALSMAQNIESLEHLAKGYLTMASYQSSIRKDREAVKMYKKYVEVSDQLALNDQNQELLSARIEYQTKRHNDEINALSEQMNLQKRIQKWIIIVGLVIFLAAVSVISSLLYALKLRRRSQKAMVQLEKTRMDFFTNVTHEFRTPLTIILGIGKELEKNVDPDSTAKQDVESILTHGNNLLQLVNQLLDISRVKSSVGNPDWRRGNLNLLVGQIVESIRVYASQNFITVDYENSEDEMNVDFIPEYIKKTVSNLITNAVKYTQRGGKVLVKTTMNNGSFRMSVIDNGPGIDPEHLPHIFEPFYMGDNMGKVLGSGVGLAMVKQMVEVMGGTIDVNSKLGVGSTFTVVIPQQHSNEDLPLWSASEALVSEKTADDQHGDNLDTSDDVPVVLVAEDNDDISSFIGRLLSPKYKVFYARNGQEAYDKAQEYMPDMIITDVMMPIMNGYELIDKVRSSLAINHIPIMVVSAKSSEEDRLEALRKGANMFLTKPFQPDELRMLVSNSFESRAHIRESYSGAMKDAKPMEEEIPVAHKEFLANLNRIIFDRIDDLTLNSESIADAVCLSQRQLNRKVKTITGIDTLKYIRGCRLSYACKLLTTTDVPIGDIVSKCGFDSASYFAKMFKQTYGVTPSQARKNPSSVSVSE